MKQLVKIQTDANGRKAVSAREMYSQLGLDISNWKRWSTKNIEKNTFATEGKDWVGFVLMTNGNEVKDYVLNIDFAKKLSMQARTIEGERVRDYFLEVERIAMQGGNVLAGIDSERFNQLEYTVKKLSEKVGNDKPCWAIVAFARQKEIQLFDGDALSLGKRAAKLCRERGIFVEKVVDNRTGYNVGLYPLAILSEVFTEFVTEKLKIH